MTVVDLLERRLLAALDQSVSVSLPPGWDGLHIRAGKRRAAAAALLRVADQPDLAAMIRLLDDLARQGREGKGNEERSFWRELSRLLAEVAEPQPGAPASLLGLRLWNSHPGEGPLGALLKPLRPLLPHDPPVREEFLAEAGRILLCAQARFWMDEQRRADRASAAEVPS